MFWDMQGLAMKFGGCRLGSTSDAVGQRSTRSGWPTSMRSRAMSRQDARCPCLRTASPSASTSRGLPRLSTQVRLPDLTSCTDAIPCCQDDSASHHFVCTHTLYTHSLKGKYAVNDREKILLERGMLARMIGMSSLGQDSGRLPVHHAWCAPAACSSSFLALHDACVDLQRGRVDYAMVGGASALLRPATTVAFNQLQ